VHGVPRFCLALSCKWLDFLVCDVQEECGVPGAHSWLIAMQLLVLCVVCVQEEHADSYNQTTYVLKPGFDEATAKKVGGCPVGGWIPPPFPSDS